MTQVTSSKKTTTANTITANTTKVTTPKKVAAKVTTPKKVAAKKVVSTKQDVTMINLEQVKQIQPSIQEQQEQVQPSVEQEQVQPSVEQEQVEQEQVTTIVAATPNIDDVITKKYSIDLINVISKLPTTSIKLVDIYKNEGKYQPRIDSLNKAHVALLADSDMENWTPIIITPASNSEGYDLVDGYHRYEAASKQGALTINAKILPASYLTEDASIIAAMINVSHGLTLSKKDRKELVKKLYKEVPTISYRALGKLAGVSHETARAIVNPAKKTAKTKDDNTSDMQEQELDSKQQENKAPVSPFEDALDLAVEALGTMLQVGIEHNFSNEDTKEVVTVLFATMAKNGFDMNRVADMLETYNEATVECLSKFDSFAD